MFFPWHATALLAMESQVVIGLRMMRLLAGGWEAYAEVQLMVGEKLAANLDAAIMVLAGASTESLVAYYRERVVANSARLLTRPA